VFENVPQDAPLRS